MYDVIVIGSGPGGYVAAIRAAQLGMKTAIVEKYSTLGGTCLNVGCIPSKALLDSSEHYHNAAHTFKTHGINLNDLQVDLAQMISRKDDVVKQNVDGIQFLMKKNKIDVHHGLGSFVDAHTVNVIKEDGTSTVIQGKNIIINRGPQNEGNSKASDRDRWRSNWNGARIGLWTFRGKGFCCRVYGFYHSYHGQNHGQRTSEVSEKTGF
jgi:pyruvate/2-oxoglutarate dehydrogenase complex dihydrolipoamide dehydrogenase (E3) component